MKEIPFPDGVIPLEIFVGSVGKERTVDTVDGRPGVVDYGFNYTDRPVSLFLRIKAADAADFRLLRNEVFATFDVGSAFYVAEADVPSRVLKVVVDESYIPDRLTEEYADFDINCRTLDSVFWESKYTTLELHDSGYSATAEKYGLVDNIDDEKVQYRFEPEIFREELTKSEWEVGSISSGTGENSISDTSIRTKGYFKTIPGQEYVFEELLNSPKVSYWWIMEYDNIGNYIGFFATQYNPQTNKGTFTARGSRVRMRPTLHSGQTISVDDVGVNVRPTITGKGLLTSFSVYNAGNVTVEPESMMLNIIVSTVQSDNNFTIRNKTTREEIILKRASAGYHFRIKGMVISLGAITNIFRDTNREFISLAPGDNEFEILNGTFGEIRFEFKYLYK